MTLLLQVMYAHNITSCSEVKTELVLEVTSIYTKSE